MRRDEHLRDDELVLALDGELDGAEMRAVEAHLAGCVECRGRRAEFERASGRYAEMHAGRPGAVAGEVDGPLGRLRRAMAGGAHPPMIPVAAAAALVAVTIAGVVWMSRPVEALGPLPDARLTPGAARLVSRSEVCVVPAEEDGAVVPVELAHRVFEEYRIARPEPRAYEVDYLISPRLGGAADIRNLWPQPYNEGVWNSRVKDALEDHLRGLVCDGSLELEAAQRAIATDWISAYRKYFRTERPLAAHARYEKDRPWE